MAEEGRERRALSLGSSGWKVTERTLPWEEHPGKRGAGGVPGSMPHWPPPAVTTTCSQSEKMGEGCWEPAAGSLVNCLLLAGLFVYEILKPHFALPVAGRQPGWV
ncbi:unnamed protein product [Rangifer tarandus platyrhynchus]|uniref:Uncharacterized protein n=1 Tax=Rangifer tarandus platyrhynchus TaxID=3082113 RepID=A0AC59YZ13_RANTA